MTMSEAEYEAFLTGETAATTDTEPAAAVTDTEPAKAAEPTLADVLGELRKAQNDAAALRRIIGRQERQSGTATQKAVDDAQRAVERVERLERDRRFELMTDAERADELEKELAAAKAAPAPATDVVIDRASPVFRANMADAFMDQFLPDVQAIAEDNDYELTPDDIQKLSAWAADAVQNVNGLMDFDGWIKTDVRRVIRDAAKADRAKAVEAQKTSPVRAAGAAAGDTARGSASGGNVTWEQALKMDPSKFSDAEIERLLTEAT